MRRYDDPVEVRTGPVPVQGTETVGHAEQGCVEGPAQFLWRGRLWKVRAVVAHWVETGAWWQSGRARAVRGTDVVATGAAVGAPRAEGAAGGTATVTREPEAGESSPWGDLLGEREVWRVEAGRPGALAEAGRALPGGVFDLAWDASTRQWQLVGCAD